MLAACLVLGSAAHADPTADANKALEALKGGDDAGAVRLLTKALASGRLSKSDRELAYVKRAQAYAGESNTAAALADLDRAAKLNPGDKEAAGLRSQLLAAGSQPEAAPPASGGAESQTDGEAGLQALQSGDDAQAATLFTRVLDSNELSNRDRELALVKRAEAYAGENQTQAALADLESAAALDPSDSEAKGLRTRLLAAASPPPPAEAGARTQFATRARGEASSGQKQDAVSDLNKALDADSDLPPLSPDEVIEDRRLRGALNFDLQDYGDASLDFGFISAAHKDTWQDDYKEGYAYLQLTGHAPKAVEGLEKAETGREADPGDSPPADKLAIELALGQAYAQRGEAGDVGRARKQFALALQDDPQNAAAANALSSLPQTLPRPSFDEPVLEAIPMPTGVSNLTDAPPTQFCKQEDKNVYLASIASASDIANNDIAKINNFVDNVLQPMLAQYYQDQLNDEATKNEYWGLINDEWHAWLEKSSEYHARGDALLPYWNRVNEAPLRC